MSRLRQYGPMAKRSQKVIEGEDDFKAVYAEVDARSGGRCEVTSYISTILDDLTRRPTTVGTRCARRAVEHDHLFKPRRSHHTASQVVHICRGCHDRKTWPFTRGRLVYLGTYGTEQAPVFLFALRTQNSKWQR